MSNIPTPKPVPPIPQQVDGMLGSVISASHTLIGMDPGHISTLRTSFLKSYSHPVFQLILGLPPQSTPAPPPIDNQLKAELAEIKSTISALSKAVSSHQPMAKGAKAPNAPNPPTHTGNPSAQGKGPTHVTTPTYHPYAAAAARSGLVLNLGATSPEQQLSSELTSDLNGLLHDFGHEDITFSAARYTKKGSLVLTAQHTTSQSQLNLALPDIKTFIERIYASSGIQTPPNLTARANVKWSKILIHSVPVGTASDRGPWSPDECHRALIAHNPSYAALKVTQKPSWVRTPSTLLKGTHSSLVVAFEDPDGSARRTILSQRQLYLLGTRAKVSRWKEKPRTTSKPDPSPAETDDGQVEELIGLEPQDLTQCPSTPDVTMSENPSSPTLRRTNPDHPFQSASNRKHTLPLTPSKPKATSSPKKKRLGSR
jgi:hypothetical protein